jgi:pSer/pThr/pTyr-binding forkhead associated (FHA) protein
MLLQPRQYPMLLIEDDGGRWQILLTQTTYSIGRDPGCDICLRSQFVSRYHARLIWHSNPNEIGGYYTILDGNPDGKRSANGLLIGGRKSAAHNLRDGDEVVFGPGVRVIYYLVNREDGSSEDAFVPVGSPNPLHDASAQEEVVRRPLPETFGV